MIPIDMNEKTKAWVRKNGGVVTLYPLALFPAVKHMRIMDVMPMLAAPYPEEEVTLYKLDDIAVYVHRDVQPKKHLKIVISGYGPFQHLACTGFKRIYSNMTAS
ncbi:hypothetical protein SAMN05192534_10519 [Alteribacillus persepolensis]|uniref:Uncharacterized protein n=1 Tax=Alteribacillus persepolensis TaxID=568899 RepID=A0A1G8C0F5_9BACI|nr:hypothetical protein [Alteribacillus persepolensis]SDH38932.1 hypothetical protein SAMN05192534_10519 [Alteribacillus persepolensis]